MSKGDDSSRAYKLDRIVRGAKAWGIIGMLLGTLVYFLIGKWVPESAFAPVVLISGAILAILGGLYVPIDLAYHDWNDDPDNITPADRVKRLQAKSESHD